MKDKINVITTRLQDLLEDKATLGLIVKEETRLRSINRRLQDLSCIVGQQAQREVFACRRLLGMNHMIETLALFP
ncbi:hypothetical protein HanIR_Chr13g0662451 [Helianthus annuus]|nr:hypothetical protein HanIR_Chr13g0662451 [Helianthus annuus]